MNAQRIHIGTGISRVRELMLMVDLLVAPTPRIMTRFCCGVLEIMFHGAYGYNPRLLYVFLWESSPKGWLHYWMTLRQ